MDSLEEQINKDIKERLTEHRYIHSIGVMKKAEELARFYGLDSKKARLIGIVHDIAKQMKPSEIEEYISKYNVELDEIEKSNTELIHAKIGADISKRKYNFDDQMVEAVKYHTTGHPNMDMMAKIIFIADKIEENRNYEGVEEKRQLAFLNIDKAIIETIEYTTKDSINRGKMIHTDSIDTRNYLLKNNLRIIKKIDL